MTGKIKVTLTLELSDLWGAEDAYADGGSAAVLEVIKEDIGAFFEEAEDYGSIKIERVS